MRINRAILLSLLMLLLVVPGVGQDQASPSDGQTAICTFPDDAEISVRYQNQEFDKKNEPPAGQPWAPGGAPIYLFTPTELVLGSTTIPTGAYSIYTIPNKGSWILIVNRNVTKGSPYDEKQDLVRVNMETAKLAAANKPLSVSLGHVAPKVCSLQVVYGDTGAWAEFKEK